MHDGPRATDNLAEQVADLHLRLNRVLRGIHPDPWVHLDLTTPQLKVMFFLERKGATPVGAIAAALRVSPPTVTGILDRLVEQRLVRRLEDPDDRRLVLVSLTERGSDLLGHLHEAGRARLVRVLERLEASELLMLQRALSAFLEAAKAEREEQGR